MKSPRLVLLGVCLCLAIIVLLLLPSRSNRSAESPARSTAAPSNTVSAPVAVSRAPSDNRQPRGLEGAQSRPVGHTVAQLQEIGFEITADRVGESSGEGNAAIRDPNGFKFTGNDFSITADGKHIVLTGQVSMEMQYENHTKINTSVDKNAIVRIAVDGSLISLPGVSTVKTVPLDESVSEDK